MKRLFLLFLMGVGVSSYAIDSDDDLVSDSEDEVPILTPFFASAKPPSICAKRMAQSSIGPMADVQPCVKRCASSCRMLPESIGTHVVTEDVSGTGSSVSMVPLKLPLLPNCHKARKYLNNLLIRSAKQNINHRRASLRCYRGCSNIEIIALATQTHFHISQCYLCRMYARRCIATLLQKGFKFKNQEACEAYKKLKHVTKLGNAEIDGSSVVSEEESAPNQSDLEEQPLAESAAAASSAHMAPMGQTNLPCCTYPPAAGTRVHVGVQATLPALIFLPHNSQG